jgi:hypothetical protein
LEFLLRNLHAHGERTIAQEATYLFYRTCARKQVQSQKGGNLGNLPMTLAKVDDSARVSLQLIRRFYEVVLI